MGKVKGINELVEKYNRLRGREKEAVRESMEALQRAFVESDEDRVEREGLHEPTTADEFNEDHPVISIFTKDNGILDGNPNNK